MTTVAIDTYILDTLMADLVGHDRQPSAFLVYLFLWMSAYAPKGAPAKISPKLARLVCERRRAVARS